MVYRRAYKSRSAVLCEWSLLISNIYQIINIFKIVCPNKIYSNKTVNIILLLTFELLSLVGLQDLIYTCENR